MNHAQKLHLKNLIEEYAEARVADSWKGGADPLDVPPIEQDLKDAKRALFDSLTIYTSNDTKRLELLLEVVLAAANGSKMTGAATFVYTSVQARTKASEVMDASTMKGILDVALAIPRSASGAPSRSTAALDECTEKSSG